MAGLIDVPGVSVAGAPASRIGRLVLRGLNGLFPPRNPYLESLRRSEAEAFEYSMRSGGVVLEQFGGYGDLRGQVVLDYGCGAGGKSAFYATQGAARVIGVDFPQDRSLAMKFAAERNLPLEFLRFDARLRTPAPDHSCDVLINSSVLEHVLDLPGALDEMRRLLKPGGRLLCRWHPFRSRWGAHLRDAIGVPYAQLLFSEATIMREYARAVARSGASGQPEFGGVHENSESFDDLLYPLNRVTVREMGRLLRVVGFRTLSRRWLRETRQPGWLQRVPERFVDFFLDYEAFVAAPV